MALLNHPPKKILILAIPEFGVKGKCIRRENDSLQENVSRAAFPPINHESRRISGAFVEVAFKYPLRGRLVEVPLHRSEHAVRAIFIAGVEQSQQPAGSWKFVVIDEGDKIAVGVFNSLVPRERDILPRLDPVRDGNRRNGHE